MDGTALSRNKDEDDEGIANNVQIHVSVVRKPILNYNEMSRIDKGDHHHCNWRQEWETRPKA